MNIVYFKTQSRYIQSKNSLIYALTEEQDLDHKAHFASFYKAHNMYHVFIIENRNSLQMDYKEHLMCENKQAMFIKRRLHTIVQFETTQYTLSVDYKA